FVVRAASLIVRGSGGFAGSFVVPRTTNLEPRTSNVSVLFQPPTAAFSYRGWPRAAIGQTASTLSPRIAYIWSYSLTTGSQCGTISSILSPTLYDRCAGSWRMHP